MLLTLYLAGCALTALPLLWGALEQAHRVRDYRALPSTGAYMALWAAIWPLTWGLVLVCLTRLWWRDWRGYATYHPYDPNCRWQCPYCAAHTRALERG